jgi:exodeoxyribonuclease VII small subunit
MSNANTSFEDALGRLEKIVDQMESGDLKLDDSMKLFEEGIGLTKVCHQRLDDVEKKVKQLLKKGGAKPEEGDNAKPSKR